MEFFDLAAFKLFTEQGKEPAFKILFLCLTKQYIKEGVSPQKAQQLAIARVSNSWLLYKNELKKFPGV